MKDFFLLASDYFSNLSSLSSHFYPLKSLDLLLYFYFTLPTRFTLRSSFTLVFYFYFTRSFFALSSHFALLFFYFTNPTYFTRTNHLAFLLPLCFFVLFTLVLYSPTHFHPNSEKYNTPQLIICVSV